MANSESWKKIFLDYKIENHDFDEKPFFLDAKQIKTSCQDFTRTSEKEVRILCKQDTRESRPEVFIKKDLFLLPVKNKKYVIIKGEGYVDIPKIETDATIHDSMLKFDLETSKIGNSEMQHLDFAYASSIIRTFMEDNSLVLTIRGRKYTPAFSFNVGNHKIDVESVQTEVDAGYEGKDKVVLVEAKSSKSSNVIIRQLYYPYRQWQEHTNKDVFTLFFQKITNHYLIWHFRFNQVDNYNSIELLKCQKYKIV